jgi:hypothetical protein
MSDEKDYKPSTIWDAKTRKKKSPKRATVGRRKSIKHEIDDGFRHFWGKRRIGMYNGGAS